MNEWVNKYLGKGVDYDGAYGVQCVDLVKSFVKNVLGVKPQSIGNAIEYYNKRNSSSYLTKNFNWIGYKKGFVPQKGDICVFNIHGTYLNFHNVGTLYTKLKINA